MSEPQDAKALAGALEPLFDPALRRRIGAKAAETARRLCIDNPGNEIARLIEELAACKRGEPAPATP